MSDSLQYPIACNIGPYFMGQISFGMSSGLRRSIRTSLAAPVEKMPTKDEISLDLGAHVLGRDKSVQDATRLLYH
jgi:hypothetical protein